MKFAKKRDILVVAAIALIGAALWLVFGGAFSRAGTVAEIYYKTKLVRTVDLSAGKSETFSIEELPEVAITLYPDGSIAFTKSNCPDQVCVQTGKIHLTGQFAACLPNEIYVKILSAAPGGTDGPDIIIG